MKSKLITLAILGLAFLAGTAQLSDAGPRQVLLNTQQRLYNSRTWEFYATFNNPFVNDYARGFFAGQQYAYIADYNDLADAINEPELQP
jgi:hypothetical protein